MLSDQTCTNQTGNHRRQQSTPTLSALNRPFLLPRTPQHNDQHRRGLSVDETSPAAAEHDFRFKEVHTVDNNVRQQDGYNHMQETQQTRARPGQIEYSRQSQQTMELQDVKPATSQRSDGNCLAAEDISALILDLRSAASSVDRQHKPQVFEFILPHEMTTQTDNLALEMERAGSDHQVVHNSIQAHERQPSSSQLQREASARPLERPQALNENSMNEISMTHEKMSFPYRSHGPYASFSRTAESSPTRKDPNLTIKASHAMQRGRSSQDNFAAMRQYPMSSRPASPPKTAPLTRHSVDFALMPSPKFLNMSDLKMDMPTENGGYNPAIYSPMSNDLSEVTSFQSSPEANEITLFESAEIDNLVLDAKRSFLQASQSAMDLSSQSSPMPTSPHQRAKSMTEIDVEECIEDTGITVEEIASFIQGPFPEDSKWKCLFEEEPGKFCGKRFARKENAKSHVQTHLGDRQYVCKACDQRFVRQHDLKRHIKIHTTEKPHKCPCGKDFHRHDALTRHRQRGMCSGAFEGTPKKSVKRGRPKKTRPNTEERMEKAAKTRQYVMERTRPGSTYASSISGSSEYSHGSPPSFDNLSVTASSPSLSHKAFQEFSFVNQSFEPMTPPTSPGYSTGNAYSSPYSQHSYTPKAASQSPSPKIACIPEERESLNGLPAPNHNDYHGSPPELDLSSSSPATSNFLDFTSSSGVNGSGDSADQKVGYLNPQLLNGDFPLFDATKEAPGSANFDDFFNLSDLDTSYPVKQDHTHTSSDPMIDHGSFVAEFVNEADDIFGGL